MNECQRPHFSAEVRSLRQWLRQGAMMCNTGARELSAAAGMHAAPSPAKPSVATLVAEAARAPTPATSVALLKEAHAEAPTPVVTLPLLSWCCILKSPGLMKRCLWLHGVATAHQDVLGASLLLPLHTSQSAAALVLTISLHPTPMCLGAGRSF